MFVFRNPRIEEIIILINIFLILLPFIFIFIAILLCIIGDIYNYINKYNKNITKNNIISLNDFMKQKNYDNIIKNNTYNYNFSKIKPYYYYDKTIKVYNNNIEYLINTYTFDYTMRNNKYYIDIVDKKLNIYRCSYFVNLVNSTATINFNEMYIYDINFMSQLDDINNNNINKTINYCIYCFLQEIEY